MGRSILCSKKVRSRREGILGVLLILLVPLLLAPTSGSHESHIRAQDLELRVLKARERLRVPPPPLPQSSEIVDT